MGRLNTKFESIRNQTVGLINWLWLNKPTHQEFLDKRTERLYNHKDWKSLPRYAKSEFEGMLRGASKSVDAAGVDWCHFYGNKFIPCQQFQKMLISYSEIDPNASRHVWKDTQKVW